MKLTFKFKGEICNNKQVNRCSRQFQIVLSALKVMKCGDII